MSMNKHRNIKQIGFILLLILFIAFSIYFCFNPVHVEGSALRIIGSKYIPYTFAVFGIIMLIAYIFSKKK